LSAWGGPIPFRQGFWAKATSTLVTAPRSVPCVGPGPLPDRGPRIRRPWLIETLPSNARRDFAIGLRGGKTLDDRGPSKRPKLGRPAYAPGIHVDVRPGGDYVPLLSCPADTGDRHGRQTTRERIFEAVFFPPPRETRQGHRASDLRRSMGS